MTPSTASGATRRHRSRGLAARGEDGFTLIELLVVVVIIGLLAAIALPLFLGQQHKGQDASAKSAVRNAVDQVESCFTDEHDYAACNDAADGGMADAQIDWDSVTITPGGDDGTLYTIKAVTTAEHRFELSRTADGDWSRTCGPTGAGGCRTDGTW
jgi:type IV pilus assembly protein PilA